ncbi:MAG: HI0074 family nucleotidyltransferase substrate-binding subunit [Ignavibacteria bacterium]
MSSENLYSFSRLKNALIALKQGALISKSELEKDGVIQRFEFTFELFWKALKFYLGDKGIDYKSPKDCLKAAFKYGLIDNEQLHLDMLKDRNNTTHLCSKEEADIIYNNIKKNYIEALENFISKL